MTGFGFLVMLAVLAVPILLTGGLIALMTRPMPGQSSRPLTAGPGSPAAPAVEATSGVCPHCGAKLDADGAHCPQCGAPAGAAS